METFRAMLNIDAELVLRYAAGLLGGHSFGYQFDSMASDEVVRLADTVIGAQGNTSDSRECSQSRRDLRCIRVGRLAASYAAGHEIGRPAIVTTQELVKQVLGPIFKACGH